MSTGKGDTFIHSKKLQVSQYRILFTKKALDAAGIPTLSIFADMVDAREWDEEKMTRLVADFIETLGK